MKTIRAVGFDLDGTFLRTHVDYAGLDNADLAVLGEHGIPADEVFGPDPPAKRRRAPVSEWLRAHGRSDEEEGIFDEIDRRLTFYETQYVDMAEPFPGSLECLDALKAMGLKVGLLTRGGHEYGETALRRFGAYEKMDAVVGRDFSDYDRSKPSPAAMEDFAGELGVEPCEILYIGDNLTDWMCARDSGAPFIGVLSGSVDEDGWQAACPGMMTLPYAGDVMDVMGQYTHVHRYTQLEHTADAMVSCSADTLEMCFADAAYALSDQTVDADRVEARETRYIIAGGEDPVERLYAFLSEVLFVMDAESFAFCRFRVRFDGNTVIGEGDGEPLDPRRHHAKGEVKAVTYHMMTVSEDPPEVTAVFDM